MAGIQVSDSTPNTRHEGLSYTNLPIKISGIVFWGLVVVGLLASTAFISFFEARLNAERDLKIGLTQDELIHVFSNLGKKPASSTIPVLESLQSRFGFNGMVITYDDRPIATGMPDNKADIIEWGFQTDPDSTGGGQKQLWAKVYLPRLSRRASAANQDAWTVTATNKTYRYT